jgi:heme exporter protein B
MLAIFCHLIKNDLISLVRNSAKWLQPLLFFVIFIFLFAIGLGFDLKEMAWVSPAVIWIAFLVTSLFSIESVLVHEQQEGLLAQFILSEYPLWWIVIAKATAIWIMTALPLILISPFLGGMLQLSVTQVGVLVLSLLVGSPALTLLGLLGGALTLSLPSSGIFLGLLLLPLYIPILLLGESTLTTILNNQWPLFEMSLLAAISILSVTLAPLGTAAALKVSAE